MGINGRPIISSEYPRALFDDKDLSINLKMVTLTVINIWFKSVALCRFAKAPDFTVIRVSKCQVSHLLLMSDNLTFISSENLPTSSLNSSIAITIDSTNMFDFSFGLNLKGLHITLDVTDSSFRNPEATYVYAETCPTFAMMKDTLSLKANISTIHVSEVIAVDASLYGNVSTINISGSTFDGDKLTIRCIGLRVESSIVNFQNCMVSNTLVLRSVKAAFDHCYFINSMADMIDLYSQSRAALDHCMFVNNWGIIRISSSNIIFKNNSFINNSNYELHVVPSTSWFVVDIRPNVGLINITHNSASRFKDCHFKNNSAQFGTVRILDSTSVFENCYFENNMGEHAAAISVNSFSDTHIAQCLFKDNFTNPRGGTFFHSKGKLFVTNSTLYMSFDHPKLWPQELYIGGDGIYSSSEVILQNVSINDIGSTNAETAMITSSFLRTRMNVSIKCSTGKVYGGYDYNLQRLTNLYISCLCCPAGTYNLSFGKVMFEDMDTSLTYYTKRSITCLKCPFGGICEKGKIRAANSFWGYLSSDREVHFVTCPSGYCCTGNLCRSYNSCALGRHGTLCSTCDKSLTENVLTPDCLDRSTCSHHWFWFLVLAGGIVYLLVFMYLKEIVVLLRHILYPKEMKFMQRWIELPENEVPLLSANNPVQDATASIKDRDLDALFPAISKIVVFFYQSAVLYKVQVMDEKSRVFLRITKEILSTVFNLRTDGLFYQKFSWCPFKDLKPVQKVMFKMSFVLYLLSLVFVSYVASLIWTLCKKVTNQPKSIILRVLPCGLRIILISYATITYSSFSLLSCLPFHTSEKVLFIDGHIQCYQWWQFIVGLIVICWIASFPIVLYTSCWLLHRRMMSTRMFVLSLIFPLAVIIYWLYVWICTWSQSKAKLDDVTATEQPTGGKCLDDELVNESLDVIEGPFRKLESKHKNDSHKIPWESVLITVRLVLIVVKTFIFNKVVRLLVMSLLTNMFLIYQMKVQPFSSTISNYVETASIFMLIVICGINIIPAYYYTYPNSVSQLSKGLIKTLSNVESALLLIFPAVVGCSLVVLLCIRIFQLLIWLCGAFVRIIRYCLKPKSS